MRDIERSRWHKAEAKLRRSLQRDSTNASARYVLAIFYFSPENPAFNLDSSYRHVVTALTDLTYLTAREREKLRRAGIDSASLVDLRSGIETVAFKVANENNTEDSYVEFLSRYPTATQRDLAIQLRDEVAYQDARNENTAEAFLSYVTRYPESERVADATEQYYHLLYRARTRDGRLKSFESFLADHPDTPYRAEIYRNIFEITTADGSVASFLSFMNRYPVSELVVLAGQLAFHLLADDEDAIWPSEFLNDSLNNLLAINRSFLVPFLTGDRFGFMDEHGNEVLRAQYSEIHDDYLCGRVFDEVLIVDNKLVDRNGTVLHEGDIAEVVDIGAGFLLVEATEGLRLIHKSGFEPVPDIDDARVIARTFLAVKKSNRWFAYAFTGRLLDDRSWDDITEMRDLVVFTRDSSKFIISIKDMGNGAEGDPLPLSEPFEELRLWPGGLIWGKSGQFEGVLNQSMKTVIRFDRHILTRAPFGATAQVPNGVVVYNLSGRKSTVFDRVSLLAGHVGVKKNGSWFLYDPAQHTIHQRPYDSLRAEGAFVVGTRADSVHVWFRDKVFRSFYRPGRIGFVPGHDSTSFLTVQVKGQQSSVFDLAGRHLFSASFDALEYTGEGLFVVTRRDRKGLVDGAGKVRLPAEYDAIGTAQNDVVFTLKNKKFGAYHTRMSKLIKPLYDRNPVPYGATCVVAYKNGYYGFLGWDNKSLSGFEFDEVSYWTESLAFVRQGSLWSIFDLTTGRKVEADIRNIKIIGETTSGKLAVIQKGEYFGVISSQGRVVLPTAFSAIINLGTPDTPLYFTEKQGPEASQYVVAYYDRTGELVRQETYEDVADHDRIYCED